MKAHPKTLAAIGGLVAASHTIHAMEPEHVGSTHARLELSMPPGSPPGADAPDPEQTPAPASRAFVAGITSTATAAWVLPSQLQFRP